MKGKTYDQKYENKMGCYQLLHFLEEETFVTRTFMALSNKSATT